MRPHEIMMGYNIYAMLSKNCRLLNFKAVFYNLIRLNLTVLNETEHCPTLQSIAFQQFQCLQAHLSHYFCRSPNTIHTLLPLSEHGNLYLLVAAP